MLMYLLLLLSSHVVHRRVALNGGSEAGVESLLLVVILLLLLLLLQLLHSVVGALGESVQPVSVRHLHRVVQQRAVWVVVHIISMYTRYGRQVTCGVRSSTTASLSSYTFHRLR